MFLLLPQIAFTADDSDSRPDWFSATDDRFIASANGATLSGARGGGGGSASWVEDFPKGVVAFTGDYETLGTSQWAYGGVSAGVTIGAGSYFAEVDRGGGNNGLAEGNRHFAYRVAALGAASTVGNKVTFQIETRQIDVDTTHGNLPRATLEYLWLPELRSSLSYARSVTGNLGTEITSFGLEYGRAVTWLAGAGAGHVSPPVVNLEFAQPPAQYRETYVGITIGSTRTVCSVVLNYLTVGGIRRAMLSVTYSLRPRASDFSSPSDDEIVSPPECSRSGIYAQDCDGANVGQSKSAR